MFARGGQLCEYELIHGPDDLDEWLADIRLIPPVYLPAYGHRCHRRRRTELLSTTAGAADTAFLLREDGPRVCGDLVISNFHR